MANMPNIHKRILGIQVTRELYHALQQEAQARKMTLAEFARFILNEEILRLGTKLTPERIEAIKKEIENAKRNRQD